eukprot:m.26906 g.26906  ORF g.26906 m.26906 type:complete len:119 (+) comp10137_c0_seq3:103-459(+)
MMTLHSSAPLVVSLVAVLLTAAKGTIDPQYAINMTIYHVNELNFTKGTLVNMDTADVYGDLYFDIRAYVDPIACSVPVPVLPDCTNPEPIGCSSVSGRDGLILHSLYQTCCYYRVFRC